MFTGSRSKVELTINLFILILLCDWNLFLHSGLDIEVYDLHSLLLGLLQQHVGKCVMFITSLYHCPLEICK